MKTIKIMNRNEARKYSYDYSINPCRIISINDSIGIANDFCIDNPKISDILILFFDDDELQLSDNRLMSYDDALNIWNFVMRSKDNEEIIIHCNGGVSRSAAVAAALSLLINGDDTEIFFNPQYCPNMHCYKQLLIAASGNYDEELAQYKIDKNFEIWKQYNHFQ